MSTQRFTLEFKDEAVQQIVYRKSSVTVDFRPTGRLYLQPSEAVLKA